jgi:thioredoxin-like negative regulator of GroEL
MNPETPALSGAVLVVCLCAEWCGVCRDYAQRFAQVQVKFPQARFVWLDVEDEADLLHPLDVDDFPTLLIAVDGAPRFWGPLTPQAETLERLIRAQVDNPTAPTLGNPELVALVARIRQ